MSREWAVGNVIEQTLDEILHGDELRYIRREIHEGLAGAATVSFSNPRA